MEKIGQIIWVIIIGVITLCVARAMDKTSEKNYVVEEPITILEELKEEPTNTDETLKAEGSIAIEDDQLWVEVVLQDDHEVIIRRGDEVLKKMPCSGGTDDEPTLMGNFYLENRGEYFFSEKYDEGAFYWVRFYDQYLFHSVPVDRDTKVIQEELEKMGGPASHGCIRLLTEDAKWFYENVPDGTFVVIHD